MIQGVSCLFLVAVAADLAFIRGAAVLKTACCSLAYAYVIMTRGVGVVTRVGISAIAGENSVALGARGRNYGGLIVVRVLDVFVCSRCRIK